MPSVSLTMQVTTCYKHCLIGAPLVIVSNWQKPQMAMCDKTRFSLRSLRYACLYWVRRTRSLLSLVKKGSSIIWEPTSKKTTVFSWIDLLIPLAHAALFSHGSPQMQPHLSDSSSNLLEFNKLPRVRHPVYQILRLCSQVCKSYFKNKAKHN